MFQNVTNHRTSPASLKQLPQDPGFTWELLLITFLVLSFVAAISVFMILIAKGESPGLLTSLIALALCVLVLTVTPRLSNKYRARQRLLFLRAEEVIRNDTRPPVLYLRSFQDDKMIARAIAFKSVEQEMKLVLFDIGPSLLLQNRTMSPPIPEPRACTPHQSTGAKKLVKRCRRHNS